MPDCYSSVFKYDSRSWIWSGSPRSFDALMFNLAVTVVFVAFAVVLAWADFRTRPPHAQEPTRKRRTF
jgi:hypothetical protein